MKVSETASFRLLVALLLLVASGSTHARTAPAMALEVLRTAKPLLVTDVDYLYLRQMDLDNSVNKRRPLLVMIRYPAFASDEATLLLINAELMRRHLRGDARNRQALAAENWAQYNFARSTYLAMQLYTELEKRFPSGSIGIMPVSVKFDGASVKLSYPFIPPASLVNVDVSAITQPSATRIEGVCGTCGRSIRPLIYVSTPARTYAYSCASNGDPNLNYRKNGWDVRQLTPNYMDIVATYWLPLEFGGGPMPKILEDGSCLAQHGYALNEKINFFEYGKKGAKPPNGSTPLFEVLAVAPTTWLEKSMRKPQAVDFLNESGGYPGWGGYIDWIAPIVSLAAREALDSKLAWVLSREPNRLMYDPDSKINTPARIMLLNAAANAERQFYSRASAEWVSRSMSGEFGTAFREMLAGEVATSRQADKALVAMLLTAGLTGFMNAKSHQPFDLASNLKQAQSIASPAQGRMSDTTAIISDYAALTSALAIKLTETTSEISATSLSELRNKMDEKLFKPALAAEARLKRKSWLRSNVIRKWKSTDKDEPVVEYTINSDGTYSYVGSTGSRMTGLWKLAGSSLTWTLVSGGDFSALPQPVSAFWTSNISDVVRLDATSVVLRSQLTGEEAMWTKVD